MAKNNINYNEIELSRIIYNCLKKFKQVSRLSEGSITDSITNSVLRRSNEYQGIKLSLDNNKLTVNLYIRVYYGVNIPQLSYDVQSKVKRLIEHKTGINVDSVNLFVEGIDDSEEYYD